MSADDWTRRTTAAELAWLKARADTPADWARDDSVWD
jgi:hypothetical protein